MTTASDDVQSRTRRVVVLGRFVAVAAVLLAGWLAWSSIGWRASPFEEARPVAPDRLLVKWVGGECDSRSRVDVDESDDAVRVTVRILTPSVSCSDVGVPRSAVVVLDAPLAGRTVVNAPCEREQFADDSACQGR